VEDALSSNSKTQTLDSGAFAQQTVSTDEKCTLTSLALFAQSLLITTGLISAFAILYVLLNER
jgi:hypothetical protein